MSASEPVLVGTSSGSSVPTSASASPASSPVEPLRPALRDEAVHEPTSGEPAVLSRIANRGVGLTIWERDLPDGLSAAVAAWAMGRPESFDGTLDVPKLDVSPWISGMQGPLREWMERDLRDLATRLALAGGARSLRFFFGPVRDDRCRRFHHDYVQLRLVTTYAGPGTEWAPERDVDREAMAREWCCVDDANRAIVAPERVRHADVGDVLILKGAHHRTSAGKGAVHRSPPLGDSTRIVLIASVL